MKKKFSLVVMLTVSMLFAVVIGTVNAADVGYSCSVNYVGSDSAGVGIFNVTCPALSASSKWYLASASIAKTFLAIALTAASVEKNVYIVIDDSLGEWQLIKNLYLIPN